MAEQTPPAGVAATVGVPAVAVATPITVAAPTTLPAPVLPEAAVPAIPAVSLPATTASIAAVTLPGGISLGGLPGLPGLIGSAALGIPGQAPAALNFGMLAAQAGVAGAKRSYDEYDDRPRGSGAKTVADMTPEELEKRRAQNRKWAQASRARKKTRLVELEERCRQLETAQGQLVEQVQRHANEAAKLRHCLAQAHARAGRGEPVDVPSLLQSVGLTPQALAPAVPAVGLAGQAPAAALAGAGAAADAQAAAAAPAVPGVFNGLSLAMPSLLPAGADAAAGGVLTSLPVSVGGALAPAVTSAGAGVAAAPALTVTAPAIRLPAGDAPPAATGLPADEAKPVAQ